MLAQFSEEEKHKIVDTLAFCICPLMVQAASSRTVIMSAIGKCAFVRECKRKGPVIPRLFGNECEYKHRVIEWAVTGGEWWLACRL